VICHNETTHVCAGLRPTEDVARYRFQVPPEHLINVIIWRTVTNTDHLQNNSAFTSLYYSTILCLSSVTFETTVNFH
jgi:hypothetical protein